MVETGRQGRLVLKCCLHLAGNFNGDAKMDAQGVYNNCVTILRGLNEDGGNVQWCRFMEASC